MRESRPYPDYAYILFTKFIKSKLQHLTSKILCNHDFKVHIKQSKLDSANIATGFITKIGIFAVFTFVL